MDNPTTLGVVVLGMAGLLFQILKWAVERNTKGLNKEDNDHNDPLCEEKLDEVRARYERLRRRYQFLLENRFDELLGQLAEAKRLPPKP